MRVGLFFDGTNFYRGLEAVRPGLEVDYERLAAWLVERVGGTSARLGGAWYYTGLADQSTLERFLSGLERRRGYFVRRFPVAERSTHCAHCGQESSVRIEKQVDTSLVVDMMRAAMVGQLDALVLLSGDEDLVPGVRACIDLGRPVWLASWGGHGMAPALRAAGFDHIDLTAGEASFSTGRVRAGFEGVDGGIPSADGPLDVEAGLVEQVRSAAHYFQTRGGHLARWYFVHRWESEGLTVTAGTERSRLVERLLESGRIQSYQADVNGRMVEALRAADDADDADGSA